MLNQKRGQITIFIIIGIIIALAAATFFWIHYKSSSDEISSQTEKTGEISSIIQPEIREYVYGCIRPIALEGIEILRLQGGYIDIPRGADYLKIKDYENKYVVSEGPTKKAKLGDKALDIPFWVEKQSLNIPTLEFMEDELERYTKKGFEKCIGDFEPFKMRGFNITRGDINIDVKMKNQIIVKVDMPLTIKNEDEKFNMKEFVYRVPINMKLVHKIAADLAVLEYSRHYIEDQTFNWIVLYSAVNKKYLPPLAQVITNTDGSFVTWQKNEVKDLLKNIIYHNIREVKIENTIYTRKTSPDPVKQGVYDSFIERVYSYKLPSIRINFTFEKSWPFYLDIFPSNGELVEPSRTVSSRLWVIPNIHLFRYRFKYDVEYPVMVFVTDYNSAKINPVTDTFEERAGFTMQFPMYTWIHGNQKRKDGGRQQPPDLNAMAKNLSSITDPDERAKMEELLGMAESTYFPDKAQKIISLKTKVLDKDTNKPLENVNVYYMCGNMGEQSFIGTTDKTGTLKAKWPRCINGNVHLIKKGFGERFIPFTSYNSKSGKTYIFYMERIKNIKMEVRKIHLPTLLSYYTFTDNFRDAAAVIKISRDLDLDLSRLKSRAEKTYGLNIDNYPITLIDRSQTGINRMASLLNIHPIKNNFGEINYTLTEKECVRSLLKELSNTPEFTSLVEKGKKIKFNTVRELINDEKATVTSSKSPTTITDSYPPGDNTKMISGDYKVNIVIDGTVNILPGSVGGRQTSFGKGSGPYSTRWMLGNTKVKFDTDSLNNKNKIIFFGLVDFDTSDVVDVKRFGDVFIRGNRIEAEASIQCRILSGGPTYEDTVCDYLDCKLTAISGTASKDYSSDPRRCRIARTINLTYADYEDYILPEII